MANDFVIRFKFQNTDYTAAMNYENAPLTTIFSIHDIKPLLADVVNAFIFKIDEKINSIFPVRIKAELENIIYKEIEKNIHTVA